MGCGYKECGWCKGVQSNSMWLFIRYFLPVEALADGRYLKYWKVSFTVALQ